MDLIELMNANVYLTNIMLLPCILFIVLIIRNIQKWKNNSGLVIQQFYFLCFWYCYLFVFIVGIVLSCLYHYYMFEERPVIHKIAKLDPHFSAPLLCIFGGVLFILYYLYLQHPCSNIIPSIKRITVPIYYIALIFSTLGVLSYVARKKWYPEWNENNYFKCRFLCMHIFFHYMTYTGSILLLLLYYIEIRPIFKAFFQTYDTCSDIIKLE